MKIVYFVVTEKRDCDPSHVQFVVLKSSNERSDQSEKEQAISPHSLNSSSDLLTAILKGIQILTKLHRRISFCSGGVMKL